MNLTQEQISLIAQIQAQQQAEAEAKKAESLAAQFNEWLANKDKPQDPQVNLRDYMPKKTAALEIVRVLRTSRFLNLIAICGFFIIPLFYMLNIMLGVAVIIIGVLAIGYYLRNTMSYLTRLEREYNIK
jgi:hypothetical protein